MLSISAEVEREKRDQTEETGLDELPKLSPNGLACEIDKARRMVFAEQFKTLATASGRASDLASNWHEARHLDFTRLYLRQLQDVTPERIMEVADEYLREANMTITSLDPAETAAPVIACPAGNAPGAIITRQLSNGLTLVLRPDPRVPTVNLQAAFRTGSLSESRDNCGINQLHSALLTRGTTSRSATEIAQSVESLGASLRAGAGNNTTMLSAFCLRPDLASILDLAADVLTNPAFPEEALSRAREAQLADVREAREDPVKTAFRNLRQRLFGDGNYGLPRLGTEESLARMDRETLRTHHQSLIHNSNMAMALFGDIDPDEAAALCEERLAGLPAGATIPEAEAAAEGTGEVTAHLDKQQAILAVGFPGAAVDSEDVHALQLIHDYCANMAGPLFARIREELGLAYFVSATQFHGVGTGLFAFYLGTSPEQLPLARQELLGQIQRLADGGIPEEFFEATRTSVLAADSLENQSNRSMAQACVLNTLFGLGARHHEEAAARLRLITPEEVRDTASRYFGSREPVISCLTPPDSGG
jgi:zinc protease